MSRLRRFFRRSNLDRELAGEIAAHIQELADELMESGMSRQDALLADQPKRRQGDQPGADTGSSAPNISP